MPDAIWIDENAQLAPLARRLEAAAWIGVDTEFLREKTFFPKLCLLQLAADGGLWCVDTLHGGSLEPLTHALTAPASRKIIHAARQDMEALYLNFKRVLSPVFDTQIAAGCAGLKPQIGYAELVQTLLDVTLSKGQTRTDWSKRPLSAAQLEYAADDVLYLGELAHRLSARLRALGREQWVLEDCLALEDPQLYEPDPAQAWERLRGLQSLDPEPRARAKLIAVWREKLARQRDLPRAWILSDAAIFAIALANPGTAAALGALHPISTTLNGKFAADLLGTLHDPDNFSAIDRRPGQDSRPNPQQKLLIERLNGIVDDRAAALNVSAEILAPRAELKALAMGNHETHAMAGWRREEIGLRLLEALA